MRTAVFPLASAGATVIPRTAVRSKDHHRPATHLHFIIWAYKSEKDDQYHDNSVLDLIAETSDEALARARHLLVKPKYRVHQIIEHLDGETGRNCAKG